MYERLKSLNHHVRVSNHEVFGWVDLKVSEEVGNLNKLDKLLLDNIGDNVDPLVNLGREAIMSYVIV